MIGHSNLSRVDKDASDKSPQNALHVRMHHFSVNHFQGKQRIRIAICFEIRKELLSIRNSIENSVFPIFYLSLYFSLFSHIPIFLNSHFSFPFFLSKPSNTILSRHDERRRQEPRN